MQREKIIDIAKYRGINELICKQCGTVTAVENCVIFEHTQTNHVVKIRANCPECEAYIQWLPSRKAWRIFKNKNAGMVEIEKIDNSYLEWYLKTIEKVPEDLAAAIQELINRRTTDPAAFIAPPPDLEDKEIQNLMDRKRFLIDEMKEIDFDIRTRTREHSPNADAVATNYFLKSIGELQLRRKHARQAFDKAAKKLKTLE